MRKKFLILLLILPMLASAADELVPPETAFRYSVSATSDEFRIDWTVLPGYYLYRKRMGFVSLTDGVILGDPVMPRGKIISDEFFGESEVYRDRMQVRLPYTRSAAATGTMTLEVRSQGCADIGLCYPPQRWKTEVALPLKVATETSGQDGGVDLMAILQGGPAVAQDGQFLPPDEAFQFSAQMADAYRLQVDFDIAEGYYLYRDKFGFSTGSNLVQFGKAQLPPGTPKVDEHFGATEVYYSQVSMIVPLSRASPEPGDFEFMIDFQGCAEDGICYPPMTRATAVILDAATGPPPAGAVESAPVAEQDRLAGLIRSGNLVLVSLSFFGLGLLLAFTPCVFPMVPILSGIIVGQGPDITVRRAFTLSLIYVLAMALTYTVAGVAAALLGQNLQALFQHPGVIIAFSAIFVVLALAMFGVFELQIPAALQTKLSEFSNRQRAGTWLGVGIMGVLSALIVGPCVAAPLAAALIVIGQSGDPVRGGLVLFSLSLGMGAPLLLFGASAGHLLPRAGVWMNTIRAAFGVLMLGVAIWMLSRIIPDQVTMLLWGALLLMSGVFMGALQTLAADADIRHKLGKGAGIIALVYGVLIIIGGATGGSNPLKPLDGLTAASTASQPALSFKIIKTVADLDREVQLASSQGRTAMLDFYADWCVECKKMEKNAFHDAGVISALSNTVLLQADVTANDDDDKALLKHIGVYGPPTIAFFDRFGKERKNYRVVGYLGAREFETTVRGALGD